MAAEAGQHVAQRVAEQARATEPEGLATGAAGQEEAVHYGRRTRRAAAAEVEAGRFSSRPARGQAGAMAEAEAAAGEARSRADWRVGQADSKERAVARELDSKTDSLVQEAAALEPPMMQRL